MRRVLAVVWIWMLLFEITVHAKGEEPEQLYAQSAVLMDADSGRVLFEKNRSGTEGDGEYNKNHDMYFSFGTGRDKRGCHRIGKCSASAEGTLRNAD